MANGEINPEQRLDRALNTLEEFVHAAPGASPHDPIEVIGLTYPHYSGDTISFELEFRRGPLGMYLPRTEITVLTEMAINGEPVDMVAASETIARQSPRFAYYPDAPHLSSRFALMTMAARIEMALRRMQIPDTLWWVEQGNHYWTGDGEQRAA